MRCRAVHGGHTSAPGATWLWAEHQGTDSAHDSFLADYDSRPADSAFWHATALQGLRERIGDDACFTLLRTWYLTHRYGSVDTAEFVSLAEKISGHQLGDLFSTGLDTIGRPQLG